LLHRHGERSDLCRLTDFEGMYDEVAGQRT
jgi:hypothetical protein